VGIFGPKTDYSAYSWVDGGDADSLGTTAANGSIISGPGCNWVEDVVDTNILTL
jgi:hypothetical protein